MLQRLRSILADRTSAAPPANARTAAPTELAVTGLPPFAVVDHLTSHDGFAMLDWQAAGRWIAGAGDETDLAAALAACERAWLLHLRDSLGADYDLRERDGAIVVSTLPAHLASAMLDYMTKTARRIARVLDGVDTTAAPGFDILVVFDDPDTYYRYASLFEPGAGELGFSSGMYIRRDCPHFVTVAAELQAVEPIVAHEMTHAALALLPIPAWLNEGLAVNTEQRLCPPPRPTIEAHRMHRMQVRYWTAERIQGFWAGTSFLAADEGQMLSYDLARVMVEQLGRDWPRFADFVNDANVDDAGAAAAARLLDVELGAYACALCEREADSLWSPDPARWPGAPERGAFA